MNKKINLKDGTNIYNKIKKNQPKLTIKRETITTRQTNISLKLNLIVKSNNSFQFKTIEDNNSKKGLKSHISQISNSAKNKKDNKKYSFQNNLKSKFNNNKKNKPKLEENKKVEKNSIYSNLENINHKTEINNVNFSPYYNHNKITKKEVNNKFIRINTMSSDNSKVLFSHNDLKFNNNLNNDLNFSNYNNNDNISINSNISKITGITNPLRQNLNYFNDNHYENLKEKIIISKDKNKEITDKFFNEYNEIIKNIKNNIDLNFRKRLNDVWSSYVRDHTSNRNINLDSEKIPIEENFINLLYSKIDYSCEKNKKNILTDIFLKFNSNKSNNILNLNNSEIYTTYLFFIKEYKMNDELRKQYFSFYNNLFEEIKEHHKTYNESLDKNIYYYKQELEYKFYEKPQMILNFLENGKEFLKKKNKELSITYTQMQKINELEKRNNLLENELKTLLKFD